MKRQNQNAASRARTRAMTTSADLRSRSSAPGWDAAPAPAPAHDSRGRRMIAGLVAVRVASVVEIAGACGVSRAVVEAWVDGTQQPGPRERMQLEALHRIPSASWDRPPFNPSLQPLAAQLED